MLKVPSATHATTGLTESILDRAIRERRKALDLCDRLTDIHERAQALIDHLDNKHDGGDVCMTADHDKALRASLLRYSKEV